MTHDRSQFIRRVAYAFVVREGDAAIFADVFQPLFVRAVWREKIMVAFDRESRSGKRIGKAFAQIPVGEEKRTQAARS